MIDHADRGSGVVREFHGLQHQHTARRIRVVGQRVQQHAAANRHQRDIVHSHGVTGVVAGFHIYADQALTALGAVAGDVGQVHGTGSGAAERKGAAVGDGAQFGRTVGLHLRQAKGTAVGIDVVLQGCDHQVLAHHRGHVIGVDHRRQGTRWLDVHHNFSGDRCTAVPDGDLHVFLAGGSSGVLEREQSVAPDLNLVLVVVCLGVQQDQVVAVGIHPVGEDVLADGFALFHQHGGGIPAAFEDWGLVFVSTHHVQGDLATGGKSPAVGGAVTEGLGAGPGVRGNRDLERGAAVDVLQRSGLGP